DGSGNISLAKSGSGQWILTNSNTYSGTTTVSAGTLKVNGSHSGNGAVGVTGGTFELNGTYTGNGNVAVTGGALKINNTWSGTGQVNVGTGTGAGGQVIVDNGASLGNTPNMYVGSEGGNGTVTQTNGNVTIESAAAAFDELYVGYLGGTGVYNVQNG